MLGQLLAQVIQVSKGDLSVIMDALEAERTDLVNIMFEWDDHVAARAFRLAQLRTLLAAIRLMQSGARPSSRSATSDRHRSPQAASDIPVGLPVTHE